MLDLAVLDLGFRVVITGLGGASVAEFLSYREKNTDFFINWGSICIARGHGKDGLG